MIRGNCMAQMLPRDYTADYSSQGERKLFALFRDETPDDWIVLHSLDIAPKAHHRRRGEADFVVIVPHRGVAVIEVKSFARLREDGRWDYGPHDSGNARSPFEQAEQAKYSVRNFLRDALGEARPYLCSGVITPKGDLRAGARRASIEWNEWQAIGRTELDRAGLSASIVRLLEREHAAEHGKAEVRGFDPAQVAAILRPQYEFYLSPKARRADLEESVRRYTSEQFDVLDELEANGQLLVDGPAGTGKTMLAIEAARRHAERGRQVLLVCYNQLLAGWLRAQVHEFDERIRVDTVLGWLSDVAGETRPRMQAERHWEQDLALAAGVRLLESPQGHGVDVLIVDEAQDVIRTHFLEAFSAALAGGLESGTWAFFGDLAKQDVFVRADGSLIAQLGEAAGGRVFRRPLRRNCRNTASIAEFAERVGQLPEELGYSRVLRAEAGEPPDVRVVDTTEASGTLALVLDGLLGEGYGVDEIVVLSLGEVADSAARSLADEGGAWGSRLRPYAHDEVGAIRFESIRRFKGLEAPVVVLTDVDAGEISGATPADLVDELLYIGASRALDRLYVLCDGQMCEEHGLGS